MLTDALIKNITTMVDDPLLTHFLIFLVLIYVVIKLISGFEAQRNDSANLVDVLKDLRKNRSE
jgi:flagellar biogenesis protein FliO